MNNLLSQISAQNGGAISPNTLSNGVFGLINNPSASMPSISKNLQELASLTQDDKLLAILNVALNNGGIKANANDICMALSQLNPELLNELVTANLPQKNSAIFADGGDVTELAILVIGRIQNIGEEKFMELSVPARLKVIVKALTLFDGHATKAAKYLNLPFWRMARFLWSSNNPEMKVLIEKWHSVILKAFEDNNYFRKKTAKALGVGHSYIDNLFKRARRDPTSPFHNLRTSYHTLEEIKQALSKHIRNRKKAAKELNITPEALGQLIHRTPELAGFRSIKGFASIATFSRVAILETWHSTNGNLSDMAKLLGITRQSIWSRLADGAKRNDPLLTPLKMQLEKRKEGTKPESLLTEIDLDGFNYSHFELKNDFTISDGRLAITLILSNNLYETLCDINISIIELFERISSADKTSPLNRLRYLTFDVSKTRSKNRTREETEHLLAYALKGTRNDFKKAYKAINMSKDKAKYYFGYPKTKILAQFNPLAETSDSIATSKVIASLIAHHGNRDLVANELQMPREQLNNLIFESGDNSELRYFKTGYWKLISYNYNKPRKHFTYSDSHLATRLNRLGPVERASKILRISINEIEMQIKTANKVSPLNDYEHYVKRDGFKFSDKTVASTLLKHKNIEGALLELGITKDEFEKQTRSANKASPIRIAILRVKKYKTQSNPKKNKPSAKRPETKKEIQKVHDALTASNGLIETAALVLKISPTTLNRWIQAIPALKARWHKSEMEISLAMISAEGNFERASEILSVSEKQLIGWIHHSKEDSILDRWKITDEKIYNALLRTGGNTKKVCNFFGISKSSLRGRINRRKKDHHSILHKLDMNFFRDLKLAHILAITEGDIDEAGKRMDMNPKLILKLIERAKTLSPLCPFKEIQNHSTQSLSVEQIYEAWITTNKRLSDTAVLLRQNYNDLLERINSAEAYSVLSEIKDNPTSNKTSVLAWLEDEDLESIKPEDFKIRDGFKISDARLFITLMTSNNLRKLLQDQKLSVKEFTKQIMSSNEDSFLREFETLVDSEKQLQKIKDQLLVHSLEYYHFDIEAVSMDTGLSPTQIINNIIHANEDSLLYEFQDLFRRKHLQYDSELSEHPELLIYE